MNPVPLRVAGCGALLRLLFLSGFLSGYGLTAHAEDVEKVLPEGTSIDRYRPIWNPRSPFTLASVADPAVSATWVLVGLADDDNSPLAFLLNHETQERMTVTSRPNDKGFSIESVDYHSDILQSTVKIKTPSDPLLLRFDPSTISAAANQPNQPPPPNPSAPPTHGQPPPRVIMPHVIIPNPGGPPK